MTDSDYEKLIQYIEMAEQLRRENAELKAQANEFKNRANLWEYNAQNEHNAAVAVRMENTKLKAKLDKTIAERDGNQVCIDALKAKLEDAKATAYAESVDAGMRERRLRRALYKACANWALSTLAWLDCIDQGEPRKWSEMVQKCLAKAAQYK